MARRPYLDRDAVSRARGAVRRWYKSVTSDEVTGMLARLPDRQREIVGARVPWAWEKPHLSVFAQSWGVSTERARQLENRALAWLIQQPDVARHAPGA